MSVFYRNYMGALWRSSTQLPLDYFDVLEMLRLLRVRQIDGREEMEEDLGLDILANASGLER